MQYRRRRIERKSLDTIINELFEENGYIHATLNILKDEYDENVSILAKDLSQKIKKKLNEGTDSLIEYLYENSTDSLEGIDYNGVGTALWVYNDDLKERKKEQESLPSPDGYDDFIRILGCIDPNPADPEKRRNKEKR